MIIVSAYLKWSLVLRKKVLSAAFLLILVVTGVYAHTYTIRNYSFEVIGKTKQFVLREAVGEPGDETFPGIAELEDFLDGKRRILVNKRLFKEVSYTYETVVSGDDSSDVFVTFHIEDAKSFIIVPFPKYDSNYGFSLKLKAKDSNFMGTFTTVNADAEYSQRNNTFEEGVFDWDVSFDDLRIGKARLSVGQYGVIDLLDNGKNRIGLGASASDIAIGDVLDLKGGFSLAFAPVATSDDGHWGLHTVSGSAGAAFRGERLSGASVATSVTYTVPTKLLSTGSSFSYYVWKGLKSDIELKTEHYTNETRLHLISIGTGLSHEITISDSLYVNPDFSFYFEYNLAGDIQDPYFRLSIPASLSNVNWIDNNFREGFSLDLSFTDSFHLLYEGKKNFVALDGSLAVHYPVTSWFNPSMRGVFILANSLMEINNGDAFSWNMRGIRNDNETINMSRTFAMTLNLDFMVNFIRINGFCHTYAIPFMDFFFGSSENGKMDHLMTVGAEGIVVLDNYPGYPVRGSLGFNAQDLVSWLKGNIDFSDVEYELYIGLYFLY